MDRHQGDPVWQRDMGPIDSEHGFGTSPILFGDLLILQCDNKADSWIAALDCQTGKTRWQVERDPVKTAYATPLVYSPEGGRPQLITTGWGPGFTAYDPESGKQLWQLPLFKFRCVGSPFVAGGLVFASAGTGGSGKQMFAVEPGYPERGGEAKIAYEIAPPIPYVTTPVAHGNLLFLWGDAGVVQCLDIPTGKVQWRERVGGRYFGSPIRVGERLYCISRDGICAVLAAAKEYRLLAEVDLEEPSHSTPVVADGVMYLRTFGHLMALGN
jgi:outer membrane protein assembly factor BamB